MPDVARIRSEWPSVAVRTGWEVEIDIGVVDVSILGPPPGYALLARSNTREYHQL